MTSVPLLPASLIPVPPLTDDDLSYVDDWAAAVPNDAPTLIYETVASGHWPADDENTAEPIRHWSITDTGGAEWALRKLAAIEAERTEVAELAAAYRDQIKDWEDGELRRTAGRHAFFTAHLERYALENRQATGNATLKLPSGVIKTSSREATVAIGDEALLAAWIKTTFDPDLYVDSPDLASAAAEARDAMIKTSERLLISEVRKYVDLEQVPTGRSVVALSCGCVITQTDEAVGDERTATCPLHGEKSITQRKLEMAAVPSFHDEPVPGCVVEPKKITAKVVPAR